MHFLILLSGLILRPKIQFLENRMSTNGLLIQLMSEDIDEPVDAIIKFISTSNYSGSGYKRHQGSVPGTCTCILNTYIVHVAECNIEHHHPRTPSPPNAF